jgi:alpha-glucosidase
MPKTSSTRSKSLGSVTNWLRDQYGLNGETTFGRFRVVCYTPQLFEIHLTHNDDFDTFSYAVTATPECEHFTVTETADSVIVATEALELHIAKNPVRFSFRTTTGTIINEDDPAFGTSWNGEQVTTYKKLQPGERFVGLGEKTGPLDRKGQGYVNWNTDSYGYGTSADPLYSAIPFYIGIHQQLSYGIFFDNSYKSFFNFGASNDRFASFSADSGDMRYYFMFGQSIADIIKTYTHLTGRMTLPPKWSIGYQQCRYSYYPDQEVLTLADTFRDKDIPADVIVLDIHYMEHYKIFTWSQKNFPDPKGLLEKLRSRGFEVVVMCDPGIKVEPGYKTYDSGLQHDAFIKYPDGSNYSGQVWPGWCHFPDFSNPDTRSWWQDQFREYIDELGISGFWNDMNEIATWGNMVPENIEMAFDGNPSSMRRGRNLYGFLMAKSTFEGTKNLLAGRRPFNLTRSGYAGIQRYAAVWTGDNVAYDEHMLLGVRIVNSMGLSGVAFAGYDVGGFVGDASSKLFARWVSIGAFSPFFRGHSMINSRDSEPWAYGEEVEQISRNYIKFRYQILPYIYALFHEAERTGIPIQRSLAITYTHDHKIYEGQFQNQYLFGPYFLVAPVESNKQFVRIYLPEGKWYGLYNGQLYNGPMEMVQECPLDKLPVFVRAGAIIPMQAVIAHTNIPVDTLILHFYSGDSSSFVYYNDDGLTYDYQEGKFVSRELSYDDNKRQIVLSTETGSHRHNLKTIRVVLHGLDAATHSIQINGKSSTLSRHHNTYFTELEKFDPFYNPPPPVFEEVLSIELPYETGAVILQL